MKKARILFCLAMALSICAFFTAFAYAKTPGIAQWEIDSGIDSSLKNPIKLFLESKELLTGANDIKPVAIKGRTLIPARAIFEAMGYNVKWNGDSKTVSVSGNNTQINLTIDSDIALVNDKSHKLDVPAMLIDHDKDGISSTMIPLRFTAEALGANVKWMESTNTVVIVPQLPASKTELPKAGSDITNQTQIKPAEPQPKVTNENFSKLMPVQPAVNMQSPWLYETLNQAARDKIIVIDIGHGGKDKGAIGHEGKPDELTEKAANFPIGMQLYDNLTKAGATVYLTRDSDIYFTLKERAEMANNIGATVFVSIHNNSIDNPKPNGTETEYNPKVNADGKTEMDLYGIESKAIAKNVQSEMIKELGTYDRGIKKRPELGVLRRTVMPAIIVEGAFLSNEKDFALMNTPDYSEKYARAVARGIIKSMNEAYR